jgi:hypothetical protein
MTKGCTDTLLSYQLFLIARTKFSYFVIFSAWDLERLWGQSNCRICYKCCLVLLVNKHCIRSVDIYRFIGYDRISQHEIMLAQVLEFFCGTTQYSYQAVGTEWQSVGELFLPVGCLPRYAYSVSMSTQLLRAQLFRPVYHLLLLTSSLVTGLFSPVLLLKQRWSPPLRLQASHCSTFRIMCDVPSIAVFYYYYYYY